MKKITYALLSINLCFTASCTQVQKLVDDEPAVSLGAEPTSSPADAAIASAVETALRRDEMLADADVNVISNQGVVTLSGNVPNALAYNRAISIASRVRGVKRPVKAIDLSYPP